MKKALFIALTVLTLSAASAQVATPARDAVAVPPPPGPGRAKASPAGGGFRVAEGDALPAGYFAKAKGYLPGDSILITNGSTGESLQVLNLGTPDEEEETLLLLSIDAARALGIAEGMSGSVRLEVRPGSFDEAARGLAVIGDAVANSRAEEPEEPARRGDDLPRRPHHAAEEEAPGDTPPAEDYVAEGVTEEDTVPPEDAEEELPGEDFIVEGYEDDGIIEEDLEITANEETVKPEEESAAPVAEQGALSAADAEEAAPHVADTVPETALDAALAAGEERIEPEEIPPLGEYRAEESAADAGGAAAEESAQEEESPDTAHEAIVLTPAGPQHEQGAAAEGNAADAQGEEAVEELRAPTEAGEQGAENAEAAAGAAENAAQSAEATSAQDAAESGFARYVTDARRLVHGAYYVQIAALKDAENIRTTLERYSRYPLALVQTPGGAYRILIGPLTADEYGATLARFVEEGFSDAFVRRVE